MKQNCDSDFELTRQFYARSWKICLSHLQMWEDDRIDAWINAWLAAWSDPKSLIPHETPVYYVAWELIRSRTHDSKQSGKLDQFVRDLEREILRGVKTVEEIGELDWPATKARANALLDKLP